MTKNILIIDPDCSLAEAIDLLTQQNEQFLFYEDKDNNLFIFTNNDIKNLNLTDQMGKILKIMSSVTSFASPDWTLEQALYKMQNDDLSYLPVKDDNLKLVGVLSVEAFFIAVQEIKWKLNAVLH